MSVDAGILMALIFYCLNFQFPQVTPFKFAVPVQLVLGVKSPKVLESQFNQLDSASSSSSHLRTFLKITLYFIQRIAILKGDD